MDYVELSPEQLSPEALNGLIKEFVTRDGTDYGMVEATLEDKVAEVRNLIRTGDALIVFDIELQSATITTPERLREQGARPQS